VLFRSGDSGTDSVSLLDETFTIAGGTGLTTSVANNTVTIDLDNTAVTANTYGSQTEIPVFTVDAQGRLTAANTVSISTDLSIIGDTGSDIMSLLDDTLTFTGGTGTDANAYMNVKTSGEYDTPVPLVRLTGIVFPEKLITPVVPLGIVNNKSDKWKTSMCPPTDKLLKFVPNSLVLKTLLGPFNICGDIGFLYGNSFINNKYF
jgi:hypothetical protein